MQTKHLPYLSDPVTRQPFTVTVFEQDGDHVTSGYLLSGKNWYPIVQGIPRILIGELRREMLRLHVAFLLQWERQLPPDPQTEWRAAINDVSDMDAFIRHQAKTGASFAYEWKNIYRENSFEKKNFLHFIGPYITEQTFGGLSVVDVGCGSGRFTKQALNCGAKVAFGVDVGESVEVAYQLTLEYENACIIQADVYHLPFHQTVDMVYSIGVLHHLPQPQKGFDGLKRVVKPGGTVAIWVYNRRNNKRALYFYEPLRSILKRLPKPVLYKLSYGPALLAHGLNGLTHLLRRFGAKQLAQKIPFSYYANFSFNMKLNDTFDVVATPKSNYYYVETIESWFKQAGLSSIQFYEHPEAGITCQGIAA